MPFRLPKELDERNGLGGLHAVRHLTLGRLSFVSINEQLRQGGQVRCASLAAHRALARWKERKSS
uniref:Uncharacterized protein n=1 Tax=Thermogemmatispora argillosa TaxID=2045280 RepID=A0A455T484_9CHLR|nr:hypothetical protein KTA_04030 [Thermogemmatispora argillosa]